MTLSRVLGAVGRALITWGVLVLAFAAYQLWGTGIQEARAQNQLEDDFADLLADFEQPSSTALPKVATDPDSPAPTTTAQPLELDLALLEALTRDGGEAVSRIQMPTIGVDKVVVEGVQVADLRKGPGHYRATPLPGQVGNASIAGHRTTYGAPFGDIDKLQPGDEIIVTTVQGVHTCVVSTPEEAYGELLAQAQSHQGGHTIVRPGDVWVLDDFGDNRLTLTACHPKFSARERIIVTAVLKDAPAFTPDPADLAEVGPLAMQDDEVPETPDRSQFLDEVSLDEGLDGESDALGPAIGWGLVAAAIWAVARIGAWKWRRWPSYAIVAIPVLIPLWLCFEQVDRLLPAY